MGEEGKLKEEKEEEEYSTHLQQTSSSPFRDLPRPSH